ncbi:MAG: MFS transporter, partial [Dehalococcoidia bacterium]|nr:MFS transporter [Dehalococcoidia bacterium]
TASIIETSMALVAPAPYSLPRGQFQLTNMSDETSAASTGARKPRFYYGWIIVVVIGLGGFTQSAESYPILGVFMKPITEEFQWSRTIFSGSTLMGTLMGGIVAMIVGPMLDRLGARWTLTVAFAVLGATLVLMAFINAMWQFYALQIIGRALTMGVLAMALGVVVPKWFVTKRGRAVALGGLGQRIGNAVTPLYVQFLVSQGSWRLATAVAGILMWTVSMIPMAIFMRRKPEDMGLLPDGVSPEEAQVRETDGQSQAESLPQQETSMTREEALRHPSFSLLVVVFSLVFVAAPALNLHMIPYMTDKGISEGFAVAATALLSLCAGVGSLVTGFLSERITARRTLIGILVMMSLGFIGLLQVEVAWQAIVWGIYYGLSFGGMFMLQQVIFADFYGRDNVGAIRGIVWPVQMIFNATGPFVASIAFDALGSYTMIFWIFASLVMVASLLVFLARPPSQQTLAAQQAPSPLP